MKIEIENYKGQAIVYNDDNDKFECEMELSNNVRNAKRGSLKDIRKEIDQFVKANLEFKPFKFFKKSEYGSKTFEIYYCSAIRTDGKFVVGRNDTDSYKSYLSFKEMDKAMVYDAEIKKQAERLEKENAAANKKYKEAMADIFDKLIPCDLSQYESIISTPQP